IDNNLNCHLDVLNYGQNQWLNASIVIIIFLALFSSIVYGHDRLDGFWKRFIRSESPTMIDSPTSTIAINPNSPTIPVSLVSKRFHSIDSFRGMTILLMIFVNYGAGNLTSLKHVPWDGFNLADSVFPFFIFIMGSTIAVRFPFLND
ncbi:heparan-alpha-glucosaminide N-acetyltransferase-like protein 1, partial [Sarcoptes scabiei]